MIYHQSSKENDGTGHQEMYRIKNKGFEKERIRHLKTNLVNYMLDF